MTDHQRARWARVCTTAGWLFLLAYLGLVAGLVRRAAAIKQASFDDGVWGQRVETVSFAALPQTLVVLVPAAAAVAVGSVVGGAVVDRGVIWLAQLARALIGLCYVVAAAGAIGIMAIFFRSPDSIGDVDALFSRLGGILMSIAMVRILNEAEATPR